MTLKTIFLSVCLVCGLISCGPRAPKDSSNPVIGKDARFCNPLPMVIGPGANASGDVTVMKDDDGKYYMYCTGGGAWVSEDMLNWSYAKVEGRIPVAPDVAKYNGKYYMSGNDCPLYVADHPLGPYTEVGDWTNTPDVANGWNGAFDTQFYVDDDNTPYLFYSGRGISGIYAVKLDPKQLNRFDGPCVNLITFNPEHWWERYGEMNEYSDVAWIEGPWVIKHNGTYYLQYSASGTQWKTYAEGYYTSKSLLGPYKYEDNNPLLRKTEGLVTGTAHGSIVEGPDGNLWQFYTIVLSNPPGGRRIGMDRITLEKNGQMTVKVTDTPQWAPGVVKDTHNGDSGSLPVTINKINAMNALSTFSSEKDGRFAAYAIDNSSGTWWEPEDDDAEPYIMVELSPATRFDAVDFFTIDGLRLMFGTGSRRGVRRGGGWRSYAEQVYKYKLEISMDGEKFIPVLDCTNNTENRNTIFNEIDPVRCRFVKLTITDWPKTAPLGIIEFTVFGKVAPTSLPAAVAIPNHM